MGKTTLQTTTLGRATTVQHQAESALSFLIRYKSMIALPESEVQNLSKMRTFSTTVLNEMSVIAGNDGKFSSINFFNFNGFQESVPEILTNNDITIDGKTIPAAPPEFQKAWVNISPIVGKRRNASDPIYVTDIPRLQQLVIRALLSMSYNDSDRWLDAKLSSFIIESYSMTIASQLQIAFNLNFDEMRVVQAIFALYYAQLLTGSSEDVSTNWPILINRCSFLGSQAEISDKLNMIDAYVGTDRKLDINRCIGFIRQNGPPRMANFDSKMFFQMFSRSSVESQAMLYALDYPPYWVYLILKTLSNDKNPILAVTFRVTDLKKKAMLFASDLKTSRTFIPEINRNAQ